MSLPVNQAYSFLSLLKKETSPFNIVDPILSKISSTEELKPSDPPKMKQIVQNDPTQKSVFSMKNIRTKQQDQNLDLTKNLFKGILGSPDMKLPNSQQNIKVKPNLDQESEDIDSSKHKLIEGSNSRQENKEEQNTSRENNKFGKFEGSNDVLQNFVSLKVIETNKLMDGTRNSKTQKDQIQNPQMMLIPSVSQLSDEIKITSINHYNEKIFIGVYFNNQQHYLAVVDLKDESTIPSLESLQIYKFDSLLGEGISNPVFYQGGDYLWDQGSQSLYSLVPGSFQLQKVEISIPQIKEEEKEKEEILNDSFGKSAIQGDNKQNKAGSNNDSKILSLNVSKFLFHALGEDQESMADSNRITFASEEFTIRSQGKEKEDSFQNQSFVGLLHPYDASNQESILSIYSIDKMGINLLQELNLELRSAPLSLEISRNGSLVVIGCSTELKVYHLRKNKAGSSKMFKTSPTKPNHFFNNKSVLEVQFNNTRNKACVKWTGPELNTSNGILWAIFTVNSAGAFKQVGQIHKEMDHFGMVYSKESNSIAILHHKMGSFTVLSLFQVNSSNKDIIVFSRNINKGLFTVDLQRGLVLTVEPQDSRSKHLTHLKIFKADKECGTLRKVKMPSFLKQEGEDVESPNQRMEEPGKVYISQNGSTFLKIYDSKLISIVDKKDQKIEVSTFQIHNPVKYISISSEGSYIILLENDQFLKTDNMVFISRGEDGSYTMSKLKMDQGMQFLGSCGTDFSLVIFYNQFSRSVFFYSRDLNSDKTDKQSRDSPFKLMMVCSLKNYVGPRGDFKIAVLGEESLFSVIHDSYCKLLELRDHDQTPINILQPSGLQMAKNCLKQGQELSLEERITFKKTRSIMEGVTGPNSLNYLVIPYIISSSNFGISIWEKDLNEDSYCEIQKFRGFSIKVEQIFFRESTVSKINRRKSKNKIIDAFICSDLRSHDLLIFQKSSNTDSFHLHVRVNIGLTLITSIRPNEDFSKIKVCGENSAGQNQLLEFNPNASFFGNCVFLKRRVVEIFGVSKSKKRTEIRVDETLLDSLCDSIDNADIMALGSIRLLSILIEVRNYKLLDKALKLYGYNSHLYPEDMDPLTLALNSKDRTVLDILGAHLRKKGGSFELTKDLILEGLESNSQIFRGFITQNFLKVSRPTYPLKYQLATESEPLCLHKSSSKYSLDSKFKEWIEKQTNHGGSQDYNEVKYLTASVKADYRISSTFMKDIIKVVEEGNHEITASDLKSVIWALWDQNLFYLKFMAVSFWIFSIMLIVKLTACRNKEECQKFFAVLGCTEPDSCEGIMQVDRLPHYISRGSFVVMGVALLPLMFYELLVISEKKFSYFGSLDNFFDLSIYIGIFPLMYFVYTDPTFDQEPIINFLETIYIFFVGIRAIFYLRVQDKLRHFIRMMIQVFKDIEAFCIVMFTLIFVISVIMVLQKRVDLEDITYLDILVRFSEIYLLGFGEFQETSIIEMKWYQSIVFFLQTVLFTLIMFNFLIAIVSATHDEISDESEYFSIREQASLLTDMSHFRIALSKIMCSRSQEKYLHLVIGTDEVRYTYGKFFLFFILQQ